MKSTLIAAVLIACCLLPTLIYSQAGSLDLSFNSTGIVTTAVGTGEDQANAVAIQADGKIVVVGNKVAGFSTDVSVIRYNGNGSLDNTFGTGGKTFTDFGTYDDNARAVAIQTDGKIVVAGYSTIVSKLNFTIARYQTNGSLDSTFGTNGKQNTSIGIYNDYATAIAIQTDGKIVVTGYTQTNGASYFTDFAMVRYDTNGSLDNNFGTGGIVTTDFGSIFDYAFAIALQTDGKIVLAGESSTNPGDVDFAVARYNTDGNLDTTFDSDGKLITDFGGHNDEGMGVGIQTDGKIVVGGFTNDSVTVAGLFAVTRYNTNGTLDTTFDHDGRVKTNVANNISGSNAMVIQPDGKIVLAGYNRFPGDSQDFAVVRYTTNGSLDTSFDADGKVLTDVGSTTETAQAMALQTDGKIVVVGTTNNGSNLDVAIVRYGNFGTVDVADVPAALTTTTVYPNPFSGELKIKGTTEKGEIILFDVTGKEIIRERTTDEETKINTQKIISGYYVLSYIEENRTSNTKLLKF